MKGSEMEKSSSKAENKHNGKLVEPFYQITVYPYRNIFI
jgi:hypothetical protein